MSTECLQLLPVFSVWQWILRPPDQNIVLGVTFDCFFCSFHFVYELFYPKVCVGVLTADGDKYSKNCGLGLWTEWYVLKQSCGGCVRIYANGNSRPQ